MCKCSNKVYVNFSRKGLTQSKTSGGGTSQRSLNVLCNRGPYFESLLTTRNFFPLVFFYLVQVRET